MIVTVSGLPGSGKSYFAERLSRRLGASYINSDQVRQAMRASGKYSYEDKLIVYKEMARQAEVLMEEGKNVVVDATFYRHTLRKMFLELANEYTVPAYFIEIVADEPLIRKRLMSPRAYSEADYNVYEKLRDDFEEITLPHLILESKNDNIEIMLSKALQYINGEGE